MLKHALLNRIERKTARVGIIGVGYVGLPLATVFAEAGFHVTGFDVNARRMEALNRGESYIEDVPASKIAHLREAGQIGFHRINPLSPTLLEIQPPSGGFQLRRRITWHALIAQVEVLAGRGALGTPHAIEGRGSGSKIRFLIPLSDN